MKVVVYIKFAVLVFIVSCTQNHNLLEHKQKQIEYYQLLADSFYYEYKLDSAIKYYEKAYKFSQQAGIDFKKQASDNIANVAYCYSELDNYSVAINFYKKALEISQEIGNLKDIATLYSNMGVSAMLNSQYNLALECFMNAVKIDEQIYNITEISTDYNNLGKLYEAWNQYELAKHYYQKALVIDKMNNDSSKLSIRYNSIGMLFKNYKKLDSALVYLQKALEIDKANKNYKNIATRQSNIGQIFLELQDFENAKNNLFEAYNFFAQNNIEKSSSITLNSIGDYYLATKNLDNALSSYNLSLEIAKKINYQTIVIENLKDLSFLYFLLKDFEIAYKYKNDYILIRDSLFTAENQKLINEFHVKYETEKKENTLKEQQIIIKKNKARQIIIALVASLLLLVSILLFINFRNKRKFANILSKKNDALLQSNAMKDKLFSVVAHDLKNNVSGLSFMSSTLNQNFENISSNELKEYLQTIEQATLQLNSMLMNLLQWTMCQKDSIKVNISKIDTETLLKSVIDKLRVFLKNKNIEIIIENSIKEFFSDKQILETILNNLVFNAIKFSKNQSKIIIKIKSTGDFVTFEVVDFGIGISTDDLQKLFDKQPNTKTIGTSTEKGTGIGLMLCKELILYLKGNFFVESKLNEGSTFGFTIPKNYGK